MTTLTRNDLDMRVAGQHVMANTVEQATKNHAAAVTEESLTRELYDVRTAELEKLDAGLLQIAGERDTITVAQSPKRVDDRILAGVTGTPEDRVAIAGTDATLQAQQAFLTRIQTYGHQVLRPRYTLAQMKSMAEWLDSVAVVATWACFIHARAVYDAGQAVRQLEGQAPLFGAGSVSSQKLELARQAWGRSNEAWMNFFRLTEQGKAKS